jgi:hypothetical protein
MTAISINKGQITPLYVSEDDYAGVRKDHGKHYESNVCNSMKIHLCKRLHLKLI